MGVVKLVGSESISPRRREERTSSRCSFGKVFNALLRELRVFAVRPVAQTCRALPWAVTAAWAMPDVLARAITAAQRDGVRPWLRALLHDPCEKIRRYAMAALPKIGVPSIVLHGALNGVNLVQSSEKHARYFSGPYERRVLENVGHNPPQEAPRVFAQAVLDVCKRA